MSKGSLSELRNRVALLSTANRRDTCWEIGWFQVPMLVKEPGEAPINPYLLVCIDTASRFVLGNLLLKDTPRPMDLFSLLVASMEAALPGEAGLVLPRSVRLNDSGALKLLRRELRDLGIDFQFAEELRFVREFARISEQEFFARRQGYAGHRN